ncbi:hypothetical protein KGF57_004546 [Candida theae]|uniref:Uncharacterized protein n=1 Tax=Candida theae TaxID=1198502 RepID=A0AAD5BAS1_9ASCO|nr:uncharacterized protein KGF57_004546 [Candida theae]KAI5949723.1 hypothetical protein KGF57_004546 [Candida theae]
MTGESPLPHPGASSMQQNHTAARHIKQEPTPNANATPASTDNDDEIDSMPFEELQQLYHTLQEQFKVASSQLSSTFENEQSQRKTLSYFERRNQAILNILEHLEDNSTTNDNFTSPNLFDTERINRIVEKVPRLAKTLSPLTQHPQLFANVAIPCNLLLNAYLIENIPDIINDDLTSIEINPQSIEAWCRRNRQSVTTNLVPGASKPVTLEMLKRLNVYNGVEFDLGIDGKMIVTPQAASSSSKKRKRK